MKTIPTHYDVLKVARDAPASVIRAAYRTLSQEFHPDRSHHPDADRIMKEINVSYGILSDATQRQIHDQWIAKQEAMAAPFTGHQPGSDSSRKPEPKPDPQPSRSRSNPSQQSQQAAAPAASRQDRRWGLCAVPVRVWILAAIVLSYSLWLLWSRIIVGDMQSRQSASLTREAPGKRMAPAADAPELTATSRKSLAADDKSVTRPSHKSSPREYGQVRLDRPRAPRNHRDDTASASGSVSAVVGLHDNQPPDVSLDNRGAQAGELGNNDNPTESMVAGNARAKEASRGVDPQSLESSQRFVLQVAALSSLEKAAELQAKLRGAGIASYSLKRGELIIVQVGPLPKDEVDKVRAKLGRIGLSGFMSAL